MIRLKELRLKKELNMCQMAKELNIAYTTYVNYEKEIREPNSETLIKLADYFNVTIDYLIGRTKTPTEKYIPSGKKTDTLAADEERLLGNYNKLNYNGKEKAQDYTEDLTENEKYTAPDAELRSKLNA